LSPSISLLIAAVLRAIASRAVSASVCTPVEMDARSGAALTRPWAETETVRSVMRGVSGGVDWAKAGARPATARTAAARAELEKTRMWSAFSERRWLECVDTICGGMWQAAHGALANIRPLVSREAIS
jgi:hypothetical protein